MYLTRLEFVRHKYRRFTLSGLNSFDFYPDRYNDDNGCGVVLLPSGFPLKWQIRCDLHLHFPLSEQRL
jgi:hypothetical protein